MREDEFLAFYSADPEAVPLVQIIADGTILVNGEETENPWIVGKAIQKYAQIVAIQMRGG